MLGVKVEQVNAKLGHAAGGSQPCSLQLRVLLLSFPQDGDVGVGVFPKSKAVLILCMGFGCIALESVVASQAKMGGRADWRGHCTACRIDDIMELGGCSAAVA